MQQVMTEDNCYQHLRQKIVDGTFFPNQRLIEMDLATDLKVNRAVIRTSLARLEQDGLVKRERYRGTHVRVVTEAEAVQILEMREALEGVIARYAAVRATDEDIRELQGILGLMGKCIDTDNLIRYSEINSLFHGKIKEIAQHATASKLLETLNSQGVRFQFRTIMAAGRPKKSLAEHVAIVKAIAERNQQAAEVAMRLHLSHVADTLRRIT